MYKTSFPICPVALTGYVSNILKMEHQEKFPSQTHTYNRETNSTENKHWTATTTIAILWPSIDSRILCKYESKRETASPPFPFEKRYLQYRISKSNSLPVNSVPPFVGHLSSELNPLNKNCTIVHSNQQKGKCSFYNRSNNMFKTSNIQNA